MIQKENLMEMVVLLGTDSNDKYKEERYDDDDPSLMNGIYYYSYQNDSLRTELIDLWGKQKQDT